ncbi:hypothetical protein CcrColossus_gp406 [Caulobacter phage CcrColossus]|uniref:Uncharacterized protein n=1 Tax=Caulobacter phage CcrColossus TaxID=1211640 RepID=K4JT08_9CAUD|nr:hypothetical protein CcrColossus_gp406 [Caulobacter phage CcrColossus]AFU88276.1 hypothetical protein CcrColossus_gp406 [Caulobacter phage CcrColossus]
MKIKDLRQAIAALDDDLDVKIIGRDGLAWDIRANPQALPFDKRGRYSLGADQGSSLALALMMDC